MKSKQIVVCELKTRQINKLEPKQKPFQRVYGTIDLLP